MDKDFEKSFGHRLKTELNKVGKVAFYRADF